ncbi:hypothetical protein B0T19DRAFT_285880 [Cercophora scortea]|uniref:Uncharacterized protein n=1 Tax=Cercophora scortea TaxID=314031 RepID=A0AAE0I8B8_9PEZI|nr:hypothetical protein B0T19DRAFT_285880 [Cercophora scortea]
MAFSNFQNGSGSPKCQESIEGSVGYLICNMGKLSVPSGTTLFSLLEQCFAKFIQTFALNDKSGILSSPSALERVLSSIFDTDRRALVTEKSLRALTALDDRDTAALFLQAVAGMGLIFRRLNAVGPDVSRSLFARELQLFSESEDRQSMLDRIATSPLLMSCYTKNDVVSFLMTTIGDGPSSHHDGLSLSATGKDLVNENIAWVSSRPCKNNGLPWGFTIMALN